MSIRDTVTGVQHVGIPTTDLEGTIAYYVKLIVICVGVIIIVSTLIDKDPPRPGTPGSGSPHHRP